MGAPTKAELAKLRLIRDKKIDLAALQRSAEMSRLEQEGWIERSEGEVVITPAGETALLSAEGTL